MYQTNDLTDRTSTSSSSSSACCTMAYNSKDLPSTCDMEEGTSLAMEIIVNEEEKAKRIVNKERTNGTDGNSKLKKIDTYPGKVAIDKNLNEVNERLDNEQSNVQKEFDERKKSVSAPKFPREKSERKEAYSKFQQRQKEQQQIKKKEPEITEEISNCCEEKRRVKKRLHKFSLVDNREGCSHVNIDDCLDSYSSENKSYIKQKQLKYNVHRNHVQSTTKESDPSDEVSPLISSTALAHQSYLYDNGNNLEKNSNNIINELSRNLNTGNTKKFEIFKKRKFDHLNHQFHNHHSHSHNCNVGKQQQQQQQQQKQQQFNHHQTRIEKKSLEQSQYIHQQPEQLQHCHQQEQQHQSQKQQYPVNEKIPNFVNDRIDECAPDNYASNMRSDECFVKNDQNSGSNYQTRCIKHNNSFNCNKTYFQRKDNDSRNIQCYKQHHHQQQKKLYSHHSQKLQQNCLYHHLCSPTPIQETKHKTKYTLFPKTHLPSNDHCSYYNQRNSGKQCVFAKLSKEQYYNLASKQQQVESHHKIFDKFSHRNSLPANQSTDTQSDITNQDYSNYKFPVVQSPKGILRNTNILHSSSSIDTARNKSKFPTSNSYNILDSLLSTSSKPTTVIKPKTTTTLSSISTGTVTSSTDYRMKDRAQFLPNNYKPSVHPNSCIFNNKRSHTITSGMDREQYSFKRRRSPLIQWSLTEDQLNSHLQSAVDEDKSSKRLNSCQAKITNNMKINDDKQIQSNDISLNINTVSNESLNKGNLTFCRHFLTLLCWLLIIITFPFSLCICLKVIQDFERAVIYRLGKCKTNEKVKGPGLIFILPCIDSLTRVDIRTITCDIPPVQLLTIDAAWILIDATMYFRIVDVIASVRNVENSVKSTRLIASNKLRTITSSYTLFSLIGQRENAALQIKNETNDLVKEWGVNVEKIEIKDIKVPTNMQKQMIEEATASRQSKVKLLLAEDEERASMKLKRAADALTESPHAMQLKYMQTLKAITKENRNSTVILPVPMELLENLRTEQKVENKST
ncbi:hypothetical protein SNEBB_008062 [Seison nebaliae]|nr:hypothetical protein SNEBB_008062 [Seison nebaliae]